MKIQQAAESFLSRVSLRLIHDEDRERIDQFHDSRDLFWSEIFFAETGIFGIITSLLSKINLFLFYCIKDF
jgi:hypothetical protein